MNDIEGIKNLYKSTQHKLDAMFGFDPADRFYSVLATDGIMGLMTAKKAGLIDWDIKPVVAWLRTVVTKAKDKVKAMDENAETTFTMFLSENWNNKLSIKSTDDSRSLKSEEADHLIIPDATPRISFIIRYEYDIKTFYVYTAPLREWCVKKQINYEGFIDALKRGRTRAKIDKKRMGKGTRMSLPSVDVLWVDGRDWKDDDIEQELSTIANHKAALEGDAP